MWVRRRTFSTAGCNPASASRYSLPKQLPRGHHGAQTAGVEEFHLAEIQQDQHRHRPTGFGRSPAQPTRDLRKRSLNWMATAASIRGVRPHDADAIDRMKRQVHECTPTNCSGITVATESFQLVDAHRTRKGTRVMDTVVIAGAARTPMGGFQGELSPLSPRNWAVSAIAAALEGARAPPPMSTRC
jgi:hypothetical protein